MKHTAVAAILTALCILLAVGCGNEKVESAWTDAQIDSALQSLVPEVKHRNPRAIELFAEQPEIIKRDSLDPKTVLDVITWYRHEISDLADMENYVIYPLVERLDIDLGLDSTLVLTVTELNKTPRVPIKILYLPERHTGVGLLGNQLEKVNQFLEMHGDPFKSPEQFYTFCVGFLNLVNLHPQLVLDEMNEWQLYVLVDSLIYDDVSEPGADTLAHKIHDMAMSREVGAEIDTLPESRALLEFMEVNHPSWDGINVDFRAFAVTPSVREGVFRAQIDVIDAFTLKTEKTVFNYSEEEGLTARVVPLYRQQRNPITGERRKDEV
jgi:hypothetical protein